MTSGKYHLLWIIVDTEAETCEEDRLMLKRKLAASAETERQVFNFYHYSDFVSLETHLGFILTKESSNGQCREWNAFRKQVREIQANTTAIPVAERIEGAGICLV